MTPFLSADKLKVRQKDCAEAWSLSRLALGLERMRLISLAFPFSIKGSEAEGALSFHWHPKEKSFVVSDWGGFITFVPEDAPEVLLEAIKMEFQQRGAFRESVTGEKAKLKRKPKEKFVRTQKKQLSLKDLGL